MARCPWPRAFSSVAITLATVVLFGWLLLIGGVLAVVHAFWQKQWSGFFIDLAMGILNAVVGFMVVGNPVASAETLTLLIAVFLFMGGIFRIVTALTGRFDNSFWVLLNGVVTLALGIMIWQQWPLSGLWVIGLFVGIDLIFYGWSLLIAQGYEYHPAGERMHAIVTAVADGECVVGGQHHSWIRVRSPVWGARFSVLHGSELGKSDGPRTKNRAP